MSHSCRRSMCDTPHEEKPIETGLTDKTIEIECPECGSDEIGVDAMLSHILDFHNDYSPAEAVNFARLWADASYDEAEQFEKDYNDDRKLDKAISADTFPNK